LEGSLVLVRLDEADVLLSEYRQGHCYSREVWDELSVIVGKPDEAPDSLDSFRTLLLLYCSDLLGVYMDTLPCLDDEAEVLDALDLKVVLVDIDL
jgi:hypothetical protein